MPPTTQEETSWRHPCPSHIVHYHYTHDWWQKTIRGSRNCRYMIECIEETTVHGNFGKDNGRPENAEEGSSVTVSSQWRKISGNITSE